MLSGKRNGPVPAETKKAQAIAVSVAVVVFLIFCVVAFAPLYKGSMEELCTRYEVPGLEEYIIISLGLLLIYGIVGGLYAGILFGLYYLGGWIYKLWTGKED